MKTLMYSALLFGIACGALAQVGETKKAPFTVTISSAKAEYKPGEPVMIHIVLKSISPNVLQVPEERHLGRGEMNYRIIALKMDGSSIPDSDFMQRRKAGHAPEHHSIIDKDLNYGETIEEDADVKNSADISVPGDYIVQAERSDYQWGSLHIRSNKLLIHVVP